MFLIIFKKGALDAYNGSSSNIDELFENRSKYTEMGFEEELNNYLRNSGISSEARRAPGLALEGERVVNVGRISPLHLKPIFHQVFLVLKWDQN